MKRKTKVIVALSAAVLLVLCAAGVAFAANGAAPGDALYGYDRAAEMVGIGSGGLQERLAEAAVLAQNGDCEQALAHAAEACAQFGTDDPGVAQANAALLQAANAVKTANQGETSQIRERVTQMLGWMATTEPADPAFGESAKAHACAVAGECAQVKEGEFEQNENGQLDETQNKETELNQNGEVAQEGELETEQNKNGELDETQNTEAEMNQNGQGAQTQSGTHNQTSGSGNR